MRRLPLLLLLIGCSVTPTGVVDTTVVGGPVEHHRIEQPEWTWVTGTAPATMFRAIYAVPSDVEPNPVYEQAIAQTVLLIREWLHDEIGKTFTLAEGVLPIRCFLPEPEAYFLVDDDDNDWLRFFRVRDSVRDTCVDLPGEREYASIVYVDVMECADRQESPRIGATIMPQSYTAGYAIVGRRSLRGLTDPEFREPCYDTSAHGIARWIGGSTHEIGHAFGLRHPCETRLCTRHVRYSLMQVGYSLWPDNTYLLEHEKAFLRASPIMRKRK